MPEEKTIKLKGVWVKCPNCNHEWDCVSTFIKVSCPSCGAKVTRLPEPKNESIPKNEPITEHKD